MAGKSPATEFKENNTAALKHGVYAYQQSGKVPEARQTPEVMTRLAEIRENLATVEGLVREQEKVTEQILGCLGLALSWVCDERKAGKPLDKINIFKMIPALANSAGRQVDQLMDMRERLEKREANTLEILLSQEADGGTDAGH